MKLTPERIEEIRAISSQGHLSWPGEMMRELLAHIDALEEEKQELSSDLVGQEHILGSKLEIAEAKIQKIEAENTTLTHELKMSRPEYKRMKERVEKLLGRIERLREALEFYIAVGGLDATMARTALASDEELAK